MLKGRRERPTAKMKPGKALAGIAFKIA